MPEPPAYAVLGCGRWGSRVREMLQSGGRRTACISTRRGASEIDTDLVNSRADIAWLCVPPGPHVAPMLRTVIKAGMHAIIEKPWLCSHEETTALSEAALRRGLAVGVDFQYCLLDEVQEWRGAEATHFGGHFSVSRKDRLGVTAMQNLGSHLLAIHRYAVPRAVIAEIVCAYESADERTAWIDTRAGSRLHIELLHHNQPILQRFMHAFEDAALRAASFAFDLDFARSVADDVEALDVASGN